MTEARLIVLKNGEVIYHNALRTEASVIDVKPENIHVETQIGTIPLSDMVAVYENFGIGTIGKD